MFRGRFAATASEDWTVFFLSRWDGRALRSLWAMAASLPPNGACVGGFARLAEVAAAAPLRTLVLELGDPVNCDGPDHVASARIFGPDQADFPVRFQSC